MTDDDPQAFGGITAWMCGDRMSRVYVVLASERCENDPSAFQPRAFVVCDGDLRPLVYRVVAEEGQTAGSQAAANAIVVPVVKKWLREKNFRNYELCVPQVAPIKLPA